MPEVDAAGWSGEGSFTQALVDRLRVVAEIRMVRVGDAPASRSEADYNFISNEVFVTFATDANRARTTKFGFPSFRRPAAKPAMTLAGLDALLCAFADIGPPDYSDTGMLQYLRTERVVPHYQTRGYKLVELVRVYEVKT